MGIIKNLQKKLLCKIRKFIGIDSVLLLLGKLMAERNRGIKSFSSLKEFEFKVFSQWGEDGIIQFIIQNLEIPNKVFVEFGVEDYRESSTRFLLINDNWSGLVMDSSKSNINFIKQDDIYWKYDLKAVKSFVTRENINQLIQRSINTHGGDIGLLAIDVDGNDYWIWEAINIINPRIVMCEYNGIFGYKHSITVPYDEKFNRVKKHYSNLYWGASLPALCSLAEYKGYVFIGCNSNGNNAFFIRKDISPFKAVDCANGFAAPKFRESRGPDHRLTYLNGAQKIAVISDMEVFDVKLKKNVLIKDIFQVNL